MGNSPFNLKILENHNIEFAITTSDLKTKKISYQI